MNCRMILLLLLLSAACPARAQNALDSFAAALPLADSIILISHAGIQKHHYTDHGRYWISLDRIDTGLLKEYRKFDRSSVDRLRDALLTEDDNARISTSCFNPHQAILMYRSGKLSYMDICFHCHNYVLSTKRRIASDMGSDAWDNLKLFFRSEGMRFTMEENEKE
jgi:hypothetical protein